MEIGTWALAVCSAIAVVGAAVVYIKRAFDAIRKPQRDLENEFKHIYKLLDNDNKRINRNEQVLEQIREATNLGMRNDLVILRHLATNNNTGEINATIQQVEDWLIERKF